MKKRVLATKKILDEGRSVTNVSYKKDDAGLVIMFSHSSVNDADEFRDTIWESMLSLFPAIADLAFDLDDDILIYDTHKECWVSLAA